MPHLSDLLMNCASCSLSPAASVLDTRSLPARSTNHSRERHELPAGQARRPVGRAGQQEKQCHTLQLGKHLS